MRNKTTLTPERARELVEIRKKKIAEGDDKARGGRRKKPTVSEAREKALEKLTPKAIKILEEALTKGEFRDKVMAALKVIEYRWGKPTQTTKLTGAEEGPVVIRYESIGYRPDSNGDTPPA